MKKTSIGTCFGCIFGLILGITAIILFWNEGLNAVKLGFGFLLFGITLGPLLGFIVGASIEKVLFNRKEGLKRINFDSDIDFYNAIGTTFKANPKSFMESIHRKLSNKVSKKHGKEKRREMERYIIERFCLRNGEQILYEFDGSIELMSRRYKISAHKGSIFVTNQRIIAEGQLTSAASGLPTWYPKSGTLPPVDGVVAAIYMVIPSGVKEAKKELIELSIKQEPPCYGYIFPLNHLFDLKKKKHSIYYYIAQSKNTFQIKLSSPSFKTEENVNILFEILNKSRRN